MRLIFPVASVILCLSLSGCALVRPYHMQIEQGIQLTSAQIAELKVGMSKEQVTYLLGTPNLTDPYHPNAWYYIYTNEENYGPVTDNQLVVNFDANGNVESFQEKDNVPTK